MFSTFERIYTFSVNAIVFIVSIVITGVCWLAATYFFTDVAIYVPLTILGSLVGILIGAYLYVLLSLPFLLSKKFDVIKNKVALDEYGSVADFQKDIAEFIFSVFKYPGLTVDAGVFKFDGADILTYNIDFDLDKLDIISESKPVLKLNAKKAFYVPIRIGKKSLGSMILISNNFALPLMHSILNDFENYMLDDQLLHVQRLTKAV